MSPIKGQLSAADLLKELESDPDWVARRDEFEQRRLNLRAALAQQQVDIFRDLQEVGIDVDSVWRLIGKTQLSPKVFPVLLDHLFRSYHERILEGIARALGSKAARPVAWDPLIGGIRRGAFTDGVADGVMAAISDMARPTDLPVLIDLITDRAIGSCRIMLVPKLMRSKQSQAREVLYSLRNDPDLTLEICSRLRRAKSQNKLTGER